MALRPGDLRFSVRNLRLVARVHDAVFLALHDRVRGVGGAVYAVNQFTSIGWSVSQLPAAIDKILAKLRRLGAIRSNLDVRCIATPEALLGRVERALAAKSLSLTGHMSCPRGRAFDVEFGIRSGQLWSGVPALSRRRPGASSS